VYFLMFSFAIKAFDLPTPGREDQQEVEAQPATTTPHTSPA